MTDQYRKLTDDELKGLYNQLAGHFTPPSGLQKQITEHVRRYYPDRACSASLLVRSEYNDNTYDNSCSVLVVYDKSGVEVVPTPATARESRSNWGSFAVKDQTEDPMGDVVVYLATQPLPALYIKQ